MANKIIITVDGVQVGVVEKFSLKERIITMLDNSKLPMINGKIDAVRCEKMPVKFAIGDRVKIKSGLYSKYCWEISSEPLIEFSNEKFYYRIENVDKLLGCFVLGSYEDDLELINKDWGDGE